MPFLFKRTNILAVVARTIESAVACLPQPSLMKEHLGSPLASNTPNLFLLNTRVWLKSLREIHQNPDFTVKDLSPEEIDQLCQGYDAIWCLGIYQPSPWSQRVADDNQRDVSSAFAITAYEPNPLIAANWEEWNSFVQKLHQRGVRVFIDFVSNHMAYDHPWTDTYPDMFMHNHDGSTAHGKDPNYPSWIDTSQIRYPNPQAREKMTNIILDLVDHADGLRCDLAMLLNPSTFKRTWGEDMQPFWPEAIAQAKQKAAALGKQFIFFAEAYWEEDQLRDAGFDYIYDSRHYNNMVGLVAPDNDHPQINLEQFKAHLRTVMWDRINQHKIIYIENQDEKRAAEVFGIQKANALAIVTACLPAPWMVHQGEAEGYRLHIDMQEDHTHGNEDVDIGTQKLHARLLALRQTPLFRQGEWRIPPLIDGDNMVAQQVESSREGAIICTNLSDWESGGHIFLPPDAINVRVFNINTGTEITNRAELFSSSDEIQQTLYIHNHPWQSQIIIYDRAGNQ